MRWRRFDSEAIEGKGLAAACNNSEVAATIFETAALIQIGLCGPVLAYLTCYADASVCGSLTCLIQLTIRICIEMPRIVDCLSN